jgi:hypothetical protein
MTAWPVTLSVAGVDPDNACQPGQGIGGAWRIHVGLTSAPTGRLPSKGIGAQPAAASPHRYPGR